MSGLFILSIECRDVYFVSNSSSSLSAAAASGAIFLDGRRQTRTTSAANTITHARVTKPATIIPVFANVPLGLEPELPPELVEHDVESLYVHAPYEPSPYACAK